jgi:bifunctional non-homologous end joining protein LigD
MKPMLATAAKKLPSGPGWAFEFKWDGVRALIDIRDGGASITSRLGNEVTVAYPEVLDTVPATDAADLLVDGEIVALVDGRPSFGALQSRMHVRGPEARRLAAVLPVTFVAFDLLRVDGADLSRQPYRARRGRLESLAADPRWNPAWLVSPSFEDGPATESAARQHGLEGVMAKRVDSLYRAGIRSPDWLKIRFTRSGDFVVVGWESSRDSPGRLSSLVLATWTPDGLRLAGKAGSGLTGASAAELQRRLRTRPAPLVTPVPPPSPGRTVVWTEPDTVVEIEFATWTTDGRLRHPVVRGLRADKPVEEAQGER